ncbi:hypothetical protein [Tychonema bourrellyi]|nr:hypothetical protein [Tychonema bourrellyi]
MTDAQEYLIYLINAILNNKMKNSSAYIELLQAFPPRPINAEEELIAT